MDHQGAVDDCVAHLLRPLIDDELSVVFHDLTAIRSEGLSVQDGDVRHFGMFKEGMVARQFMLGVVQTSEGMLIYHELFDGNTAEAPTMLPTMRKVLARYPQISRSRKILGEAGVEQLLKTTIDKGKLYALHAPEVECIGKGKARKPYEFGVKASLAVTHGKGLVVGARTFPGNPYDGHTLASQLEQTATLLQDIGVRPTTAVVDLGYRGVAEDVPTVQVIHRGKAKRLTTRQKAWLKRRQAIEPVIGHVKADHRLDKCWLKGSEGDALHAVLCAAGFNIRWLLRTIAARAAKAALVVFALVMTLLQGLHTGLQTRVGRLRTAIAEMSGWIRKWGRSGHHVAVTAVG